jgi:hypothetical protein
MKRTLFRLVAVSMMMLMGVSCTTAYDGWGRPVQTVDPGVALLGVAAAGVAGYALANQRNQRGHWHHPRHFQHPRNRYFHPHRGYYGRDCRYGWR